MLDIYTAIITQQCVISDIFLVGNRFCDISRGNEAAMVRSPMIRGPTPPGQSEL